MSISSAISSSPSSSDSSTSSTSTSTSSISPHSSLSTGACSVGGAIFSITPKTSPYRGLLNSSTGGLPHPPGWNPHFAPAGIGAFNPGIFKFGKLGGGPYRCMLISHGGGAPGGIFRASLSSLLISPGLLCLKLVSNSLPS